jgi:SlyX protein
MSSTGSDAAARLEALEIRLAHQDQELRQLSNEVYRQQQQITGLEQRVRELKERLAQLEQAAPASSPRDEIPPHY